MPFPRCSREPARFTRGKDRVLKLLRHCVCLVLVSALASGCAAFVGKPKPAPARPDATKPVPKAPRSTKKMILPPEKHWGPVINTKQWVMQCSKDRLAMLCRKPDRTDRRCAIKVGEKYRWVYASYCDAAALPCYRRACNAK